MIGKLGIDSPLWRTEDTGLRIGLQVPRFTWPDAPHSIGPKLAEIGKTADEAGFASIWVMDHFFQIGAVGEVEEPMLEGYSALNYLAGITQQVKLGTLVTGVHYRYPGILLKTVTTLDVLSGGRAYFGIGAGWNEPEYEAFGYPTNRRGTRYEETLSIVRRLLDGERVTFSGEFNQLRDAVLAPVPSRRIPMLVAGDGPRVLRLASRYGDAWNNNGFGLPDERLRTDLRRLDESLEAAGRDPTTMERTIGVTVRHPDVAVDPDDEPAFQGTPRELATVFDAYTDLGVDHLILEVGPKTIASIAWVSEAIDLFRR